VTTGGTQESGGPSFKHHPPQTPPAEFISGSEGSEREKASRAGQSNEIFKIRNAVIVVELGVGYIEGWVAGAEGRKNPGEATYSWAWLQSTQERKNTETNSVKKKYLVGQI